MDAVIELLDQAYSTRSLPHVQVLYKGGSERPLGYVVAGTERQQ